MFEHFFQCPYCWQEVSFLLDTSINSTDYIEDCEVCCSPIEIHAIMDEGILVSFNFNNIEQ